MPPPTRTVSVRLPTHLLEEATDLSHGARITEIMGQALKAWVAVLRRRHEDNLIRQALASISPQQRKAERHLAELAGGSSFRVMEKLDG